VVSEELEHQEPELTEENRPVVRSQQPGQSGDEPREDEASATPETAAAELSAEEKAKEERRAQARWYVVHTYSGMENKVKRNLEYRAESMGMDDYIYQVIVPTEEELVLKDGKPTPVERRVFPGYVLVEMILTDDSWFVVRNTPGVTGFVGVDNRPVPLETEEIEAIMARITSTEPTFNVEFHVGEKVRVMGGPFQDFTGTVDEVFPEKGKVRIIVSFFNRETPVEVDFMQVERA